MAIAKNFIPGGSEEWSNRRSAIFGGLWLFGSIDAVVVIAAVFNTSTPLLETIFVWSSGSFVATLLTYVTGATIDQLTRFASAARGNSISEQTTTTRTIEPAPAAEPAAAPATPAAPASP